MTDTARPTDWTKPAAMAIPKEGYFKPENGRYGPLFPKTPACYGFTIIAKIKPGTRSRHPRVRQEDRERGRRHPGLPRGAQAPLPALGALRYRQGHLLHVPGHLRHRLRQVHRGRRGLFTSFGINTVFENLEGFPEDWKTNAPAFIKFVRDHQRPSFLEYGEYPFVSAEEIKKALRLKAAFSTMLDQMQ